jgi:hypothetical protein
MSTKNNGGPAFPAAIKQWDNSMEVGEGMTLRDYFAAKAMQAIVAATVESDGSMTARAVGSATEGAYFIADEMLRARDA